MMVRVESADGPGCNFTAHLHFAIRPFRGDKIIVSTPGKQSGVVVADVCHFPGAGEDDAGCLLTASPLVVDNYDEMLQVVDWFKATYQVDDFSAAEEPASYYKLYRTVVKTLDLGKVAAPIVGYSPSSIKLFAEVCRAALVAETIHIASGVLEDTIKRAEANNISKTAVASAIASRFSPQIEELHRIVLFHKKANPGGAPMLLVVKEWEATLDQKYRAWQSDSCVEYAKPLLAELKSIVDVPKTLRQ